MLIWIKSSHFTKFKKTVLQAKSDGDVMFCLQLLSKILTGTLHLCLRESIYHLCIYPILWDRINTQVIYRFLVPDNSVNKT